MLFPSPNGLQFTCDWNGSAFVVDGQERQILAFDAALSGWTDELTSFHEEVAGDNHYIDVASRNHAIASLRRRIKSDSVVIDIGCSSGSMMRELRRVFPEVCLVGADYISGPLLGLAEAMPGIPFLQFNLVTCPLFSDSVDAVVLLNVLEHIEDDLAAIQQVFRIIKPGGVAVIEVPSGPHLFDIYDKRLLHFRRYELNSLIEKVQSVGFVVEERSHLGALVYPAFLLVKKRNQRYKESSKEEQAQIVAKSISQGRNNPIMTAVMRVEEALRRYVHYPAGIRCLVTCRKPEIMR